MRSSSNGFERKLLWFIAGVLLYLLPCFLPRPVRKFIDSLSRQLYPFPRPEIPPPSIPPTDQTPYEPVSVPSADVLPPRVQQPDSIPEIPPSETPPEVLPEPDWEIEEDLPPPEPPEDHSAEIEARYKADEARRLASYLERQRDLTAKIAAAATGNANLNRAVDGINRQLDVLAYPNPEPIPQPPIDVPNIIAHHVRGRVAPGESFPLTLRTVHSGKKALGKSMLKQVLTPKTSNQFEPAIEKDADGFVCIDGKTATFSFIAPYPTLWVARLSFVKLPPDADQLNITKDIVFETPLRQRNWEIVIERKGEEGRICVSDVVAMTPGRIQ